MSAADIDDLMQIWAAMHPRKGVLSPPTRTCMKRLIQSRMVMLLGNPSPSNIPMPASKIHTMCQNGSCRTLKSGSMIQRHLFPAFCPIQTSKMGWTMPLA